MAEAAFVAAIAIAWSLLVDRCLADFLVIIFCPIESHPGLP